MIVRVVLVLLIAFCFSGLNAQEIQKVKVDGVKYFLHKVDKGQTLYAISRKYSISVDEIKKANPELVVNGLKIGQTLRIPQKKMDKKAFKRAKVSIEGDTIRHKVLAKQTLYSLSKKYNISIDSLNKANPIIEKEGLEIGMELLIPVQQAKIESEEERIVAVEDSLKLHEVKPKETLFSLSRLYGVSVDSIQLVNDGLKEGLKIGTSIRIPQLNPNYEPEVVEEIKEDTIDTLAITGRPVKIAILLPFYLNENFPEEESQEGEVEEAPKKEEIKKSKLKGKFEQLMLEIEEEPEIYKRSEVALNFYQGIKIALDSLKNEGLWCQVDVYDTENNIDSVKAILKKEELKNADLIIGPLYRSNFKVVSKFAKENNIPIISPVRISSKVLLSNPTTFKVYSSNPAQVIQLAKFIGENYADSNLLLLNTARYGDRPTVAVFQKYMNKALESKGDTIKRIDIYTFDKKRILPHFKDSNHYVVALPSTNQAYVTQFLSALNDVYLSERGITFTIFGLENWLKYDYIDFEHLQNLQVHFPSSRSFDYSDSTVVNLIHKFREKHNTDPEEYGFLGFDVGYYFVKELMKHGGNLIKILQEEDGSMATTKFDFVKVGEESGYENQSAFILKIEDYELKRVR